MAINKLKYVISGDGSGLSGVLENLKKNFGSLEAVALAFGAAIAKVFIDAVQVASEFEQKMADVQSIVQGSSSDFMAFSENARHLGRSTQFTAVEVGKLQVILARLGFPVKDIVDMSDKVLLLAGAMGTDLETASKLVGATMRQFGLDVEDTARIVDVLSLASSKSAVDAEYLAYALGYVGAIAHQSGLSIEETSSLIGTLANNGIKASKAGVGLRKILLELAGSGLTLDDALNIINTSSDKVSVAQQLFGKRAAASAVALANQREETDKLKDSLDNAAGAAENMKEIRMDTLHGDTLLLKSAFESLLIEMGTTFIPILRSAVQIMTKLAGAIEKAWKLLVVFVKFMSEKFLIIDILKLLEKALLKVIELFKGLVRVIAWGFSRLIDLTIQFWETLNNIPGLDYLIPDSFLKRLKEYSTILKEIAFGKDEEPAGDDEEIEEVTVVGRFQDRLRAQLVGLLKWLNEQKIQETLADTFSGAFEAMGAAVAKGENPLKAAFKSILNTIGQFLKQLGKEAIKLGAAAIKFGTLIQAIKKFIIANPIAIGAGIALVALGAALSAAANSSAASISGAGSSSATPSPSAPHSTVTQTQTQGSAQEIRVVGEISGQTIRLIQQRAEDSYSGLS